ncbi:MAG: phage major capsid protein [Actinomycetota bacterium]
MKKNIPDDLAFGPGPVSAEAKVMAAERKSYISEMRSILDLAEGLGRDLTRDEEYRFRDLTKQVKEIDAELEKPAGRMSQRDSGTSGFMDSEGREIRALKPEERMSDHVRGDFGDDFPESLNLGKFVKGLAVGDWAGAEAERRVLSYGDDTLGGYLVPAAISGQIIDKARNLSAVVRAGSRTLPMESGTLHLARVDEDPTAFWRAENETITASDMQFGRFTLHARTLGCLIKMSVEVVEDAANLDEVVRHALSQALSLELDRAALFGEGTPVEPLGLFNTEGINEISLGDNGGELTSVNAFFDARLPILESNGMPGSVIMAPREEVTIESMLDGNGRYLIPPESWLDLKRLSTNQIPCDMVQGTSDNASCSFVGDFAQMLIGMRTNLVIEASREAGDATGSAFSDMQVWLRGYLRTDICVVRPAWFTRIVGIIPAA